MRKRIVIIGAGPTGLGAAHRLQEVKHDDFILLDASKEAGGLSKSILKDGFTWDLGGHVVFSQFSYFKNLVEKLVPDQNKIQRDASIWMKDRFIPYPLQNNIAFLPEEEACQCISGLLKLDKTEQKEKPKNFEEWLLQNFGTGLYNTFLKHYNKKVWAFQPFSMNCDWMKDRVAPVDVEKVMHSLVKKEAASTWGPNQFFQFPKKGGTGAIWDALYQIIDPKKVRLNSKVTHIDPIKKIVTCSQETFEYDVLISTMPLNLLSDLLHYEPKQEFLYSSTHVVGFGIEGAVPKHLATKSWMYFPEDNCPFYRCTVFSNYSENNVAKPGQQWSLMCEVSESRFQNQGLNENDCLEAVEVGCFMTKLITANDQIVSRFYQKLEYGYPTPFLKREQVLQTILPQLEKQDIKSRGRFGLWKYEVSNQDHSLMQGVQVVNQILLGEKEELIGG